MTPNPVLNNLTKDFGKIPDKQNEVMFCLKFLEWLLLIFEISVSTDARQAAH